MQKMRYAATLLAAAVLGGCATAYPVGGLFTEVRLPVDVTGNSGKPSKVGTSECVSVLSLVATGDCSVEAGRKNGGITKIHHVDWDARNILGIIGNYKVMVYGD